MRNNGEEDSEPTDEIQVYFIFVVYYIPRYKPDTGSLLTLPGRTSIPT